MLWWRCSGDKSWLQIQRKGQSTFQKGYSPFEFLKDYGTEVPVRKRAVHLAFS